MPFPAQAMRRDDHGLDRRALASSSFFIQDSSPMLTFSRDDWTTGYAAQPNGYDQTLHMTSKSASRVSFNIAATSLTLLVPAFENCTAIISINNSDPITACATRATESSNDVPFSLYSLPLGLHSVYWDTGNVPADTQVVFWGIDGNRPADPEGHVNVTIDDTFLQSGDGSVKIDYQGNWQSVKEGVQTDLGEKDTLDSYFNKTVAITTESGASVGFTGKGSAVYLYGNVGPDYGSATVSVNDEVAESAINLTSPWPMPYELLWYRTGLDPANPTEVIMTNLASSKMSLDFVLFTTDPGTVTSLSGSSNTSSEESFVDSLAGKVVLFFLVPAVAITLFAFAMFMLFRRRRRLQAASEQEKHQRQYSSNSDAEFQYSNQRDRDRWSDEPKSSRYSSHSEPSEADLVFVSYDEGKGQRMSEHWNKAASSSAMTSTSETAWNHEEEVMTPRSGRSGSSRSPPMEMRSLSLPQSVRALSTPGLPSLPGDDPGGLSGSEVYHGGISGSDIDERSDTTSTWQQPFHSVMSPPYPTSVTPTSRRGTLPAYALDDDDVPPVPSPSHTAMGTENATNLTNFTTAEIEKRLLLQSAYSGYNTPGTSQASPVSPVPTVDSDDDAPGPSSHKRMTHQTHTSNAPSIMSVFGSPPSEARRSVAPTPAPRTSMPRPPSKTDLAFLHKRKPAPSVDMSYPPSPSSSAKLPFPTSAESTRVHPKSSNTATEYNSKMSLPPPTSFQVIPGSGDEGDEMESSHRRKKSLGGISARSAARPDSVIIPFSDFVQSLDRSRVTSPINNDGLGSPKSIDRRPSPFDDPKHD